MNAREQGFLLLTSPLGDPDRPVLTAAQLRVLTNRVAQMPRESADRDLTVKDLQSIGYGPEMANRILRLLSEQELLHHYLKKGKNADCYPLTRGGQGYPPEVRQRLGADSPGSLWGKGDFSLLDTPKVALVGSRELYPDNLAFAEEVGRQAASQGYTLVSGNAKGADRAAQDACLRAGGCVISVVADELQSHPQRNDVLYLSEEGYDLPFTSQRALSRNRVIHSLGLVSFVAQSSLQKGGTWDGTAKNLRFGWSPVYCFRDGSNAMSLLEEMGADLVDMEQLQDFSQLNRKTKSLFDSL